VFLLPFALSGKSVDSIVFYKYTSIINSSDNKSLEGIKLSCKNEILYAELDSITELVTIQTIVHSKYISLIVYDLNQKIVLWTKRINSKLYKVVPLTRFIILTSCEKTICLDKLTGIELWKSKRELLYVNRKSEIGFTYFTHFDASNPDVLLEAINISDGGKIWKRQIDRIYGWNEIVTLNDSTVILSDSELHSFNLNNGKGWDYDALSGINIEEERNLVLNAAAFSATIAFGVFVGYSVDYFTHLGNIVWDLCLICLSSME